MVASFCGLLTVQVGVAVLAGVFFALAAIILAANIFDYSNNYEGWPISLFLMIIFVAGLIMIGILMVGSSYAEKRSLALAGLAVLIVWFLYWLVLSLLSFFSGSAIVGAVCIKLRCPETFWLANLRYRSFQEDPYNRNDTKHPPAQPNWWPAWSKSENNRRRRSSGDIFTVYSSVNNSHKTKESNNLNPTSYSKEQNRTVQNSFENVIHSRMQTPNSLTELNLKRPNIKFIGNIGFLNSNKTDNAKDDEDGGHIMGRALFGALILFIINLIFLLFSALMLWSWASELDYADYYLDDEEDSDDSDDPVIIYQEN